MRLFLVLLFVLYIYVDVICVFQGKEQHPTHKSITGLS